MLAKVAFPSFFLTLVGFILLLLVTLSVPFIKSIYILHVTGTIGTSLVSASATANAGVFGLCYTGESAEVVGIEVYQGDTDCSSPRVGYNFDDTIVGLVTSESSRTIVKKFSSALVLNPIAAGLAGLSLLSAFSAWLCASRAFEILTFFSLLLSSASAWLAFIMDLVLAIVGRQRIKSASDGTFTGHLGNAIWLALTGAIILSLAICLAGCGVFGRYRSDHNHQPRPIEKDGAYVEKSGWRRHIHRGTY